jgi:hypothetical protein
LKAHYGTKIQWLPFDFELIFLGDFAGSLLEEALFIAPSSAKNECFIEGLVGNRLSLLKRVGARLLKLMKLDHFGGFSYSMKLYRFRLKRYC